MMNAMMGRHGAGGAKGPAVLPAEKAAQTSLFYSAEAAGVHTHHRAASGCLSTYSCSTFTMRMPSSVPALVKESCVSRPVSAL